MHGRAVQPLSSVWRSAHGLPFGLVTAPTPSPTARQIVDQSAASSGLQLRNSYWRIHMHVRVRWAHHLGRCQMLHSKVSGQYPWAYGGQQGQRSDYDRGECTGVDGCLVPQVATGLCDRWRAFFYAAGRRRLPTEQLRQCTMFESHQLRTMSHEFVCISDW